MLRLFAHLLNRVLRSSGVRSTLALLELAVLVGVVSSGCTPAPEPPLRVGTIPWPGYASLHLAQSLDYYDKESIRAVEMVNASQVSAAIRNGTVDAGMVTLDEALALMQEGVDLRMVLVMDVSHGADVVMARPEIANLQGLRGKRVGVENAAVGALMLDGMLEAAGLSIADIQLVSMTVNEHADAYRSGKVDAVVTFEPVRSQLLKQGARILFDSSRIPGRIVDVLVVRAEVMADHRRGLQALIAGHFQALAYLSNQPQDAAKRIAPFLGVDPAEVPSQFTGLKLPDLAENRVLLSGPTPGLKTTAANLADLMLRHKLMQRAVTLERLVEPAFLPQEKN